MLPPEHERGAEGGRGGADDVVGAAGVATYALEVGVAVDELELRGSVGVSVN